MNPKNYKDTLLLPQTDFPMKGNLPEKDQEYFKQQTKLKIYNKNSGTIKNKKTFILHDGPPYANGNIHSGHALNKILKDFIIRSKVLEGRKVNWIFGWDTHGLPIELMIQKQNFKPQVIGKTEYLKKCHNYALEQVAKQQEQFKKLNLFTDYKQKYLTLDKNFETAEIEIFFKMLNKKLIYQDLKPIYWSWSSKTALSDAEIEYKEIESDSIFVLFKDKINDWYYPIWTTTPWTLPANIALAFGRNVKYSRYELDDKQIIVADLLIDNLTTKLGKEFKFIDHFDITKQINQFAINPINNQKSQLVYGHHVRTESGTGIVHIAGGHGLDDYKIAEEHKLPLIVVVDANGMMINTNDETLDGLFYQKANAKVIESLKNNNYLLWNEKITHSVAIDWRTKEPVIYRATKQWFISINNIRNQIIKQIDKIYWLPEWGKEHLIKMTQKREDWCISRQRIWGVPIPIIYDEDNKPIINLKLQKNIINWFTKHGSEHWSNLKIKDILPKEIKFNPQMRKEEDILDVWFDSGSSNYALYGKRTADLVIEGTDQFRGWFIASLITAYITKETIPFQHILAHGFVLDENNDKMSKSQGNVIDPNDIVAKYGSDILKLWVGNANYQDNINLSLAIINQNADEYRKIRNTIRFLLGNIYGNQSNQKKLQSISKKLDDIEKIVLTELAFSNDKIENNYKRFNFNSVLKEINLQLTNGVISYFLDYAKDILYTKKLDDKKRLKTVYVLDVILKYLLYNLAPIIPVTVEEAFKETSSLKSIFLTKKPLFEAYYSNTKKWQEFANLRLLINKEIEILRKDKIIANNLEVELTITLPTNLIIWGEQLKELIMLGKVNYQEGKELKIKINKFAGIKCQRCWKYFDKEEIVNDICNSCYETINL